MHVPVHNRQNELHLSLSRLIYRFTATVEGEMYKGVILVRGDSESRPDKLISSLIKLRQDKAFINIYQYRKIKNKWVWKVIHDTKVDLKKSLPELFSDVGVVYKDWVSQKNAI